MGLKEIDETILKKSQDRMLDILIEVDRVCRENNLKYWLTGGTLLGAVRHKDFIPWDDDMDICMLQEDYIRFLEIAPQKLNSDRYFLDYEKTDPATPVNWAKVKDRQSLVLHEYESDKEEYHQGLYIDIFPVSYLKKMNRITLFIFNTIKKIKGFNSKVGDNKKFKFILERIGIVRFAKKIVKIFFAEVETEEIGYTIIFKPIYKKEWIFPLKEIKFRGHSFYCPNNEDAYLKHLFNNYMELPPEDERVWHSKEIRLNEKCEFEKKLERTGGKLYGNNY